MNINNTSKTKPAFLVTLPPENFAFPSAYIGKIVIFKGDKIDHSTITQLRQNYPYSIIYLLDFKPTVGQLMRWPDSDSLVISFSGSNNSEEMNWAKSEMAPYINGAYEFKDFFKKNEGKIIAISPMKQSAKYPVNDGSRPKPESGIDTVQDLVDKSGSLFEAGKCEEVIAICDEIISIDPDDTCAWTTKSGALMRIGKHDEALVACDRAIELDPDDIGPWINKGLVLSALGRQDESLAAYEKAIEIDPKCMVAWTNKGSTLHNMKRYEEAVEACEKAIQFDENDPRAWMNKGVACFCVKNFPDALNAFDTVITIDPKNPAAWYNKGNVLYQQGDYENAIAAYDRALTMNPDDTMSWFHKGFCYKKMKKNSEAIRAFEKALNLNSALVRQVYPQYFE